MLFIASKVFGFFLLASFALPLTREKTNSDLVMSLLGRALWVLIIIGYIRFLTGVPAGIFLTALFLIALWRTASNPSITIVEYSSSWWPPIVTSGGYLLLVVAAGILAFVWNTHTEFVPRATIMGWDGLISWNNWAMQFAQFEYAPYQNYYPSGFPIAWSVIYDLQGNSEIWVFSALLMFSLLYFCVFTFGCMLSERNWAAAAFYIFAITMIGLQWAGRMTNGYMDAPVALLLFLGLFYAYLSLNNDGEIDTGKLTISFFMFSVAAVTKQPGLVGLCFAIIFQSILLRSKAISKYRSALLLSLLLLPSIFSGSIFLVSGAEPFGTLQELSQLADQKNKSVITSFQSLISHTNPPVFFILIVLIFISIFKKGKSSYFTITCVTISIIGFIIFHECCSYDTRNSAWINAFLFAAAAPSVMQHQTTLIKTQTKDLRLKKLISAGSCALVLAIISISSFNVLIPLHQAEAYFRDRIGGFALYKLFQRNITDIKAYGLYSFEENLSYSTLVGDFHFPLRKSANNNIVIGNQPMRTHRSPCRQPLENNLCTLDMAIKKTGCIRLLLPSARYNSTRNGIGPIIQNFDLYLLDEAKRQDGVTYKLYTTSLKCLPQERRQSNH